MKLILSSKVHHFLCFAAEILDTEVMVFGRVLSSEEAKKRGCPSSLYIDDLKIPKQEVSAASVEIDTDWWAEEICKMIAKGEEMWRYSALLHTHPSSMSEFSKTDLDEHISAMERWDMWAAVVMAKATKAMSAYYGGMVNTRIAKCSFRMKTTPVVDWKSPSGVTKAVLAKWKAELDRLVTKEVPLYLDPGAETPMYGSSWWNDPVLRRKEKKNNGKRKQKHQERRSVRRSLLGK